MSVKIERVIYIPVMMVSFPSGIEQDISDNSNFLFDLRLEIPSAFAGSGHLSVALLIRKPGNGEELGISGSGLLSKTGFARLG